MKNRYQAINLAILAVLAILFVLKIYNLWIYILLIATIFFISMKRYEDKNNYRKDIIFKAVGLVAISIIYWFYTNKF